MTMRMQKTKRMRRKARSLSTRRRGPDGRRGEADEKLREFTEADLIARRDALNAASATRRTFDRHLTKVEQRGTHLQARTAVQKGEPIEMEEPITVKSLSGGAGHQDQRHSEQAAQTGDLYDPQPGAGHRNRCDDRVGVRR